MPKTAQPDAKKAVQDICNAEDRDHAEAAIKTFAVRLRTKVTRRAGSRTAAPGMVFKLFESARQQRRTVTAPHLVVLVRAGARFEGQRTGRAAHGASGMTVIDLRPVTSADSEYCFQLHKAAMGAYVTAIWGWDEQLRRDFHARVFTPDQWQIITADGADAGMLHVEHRPTAIYLARIDLHPDYQGRGIGRELIRSLLDQARLQGAGAHLGRPRRQSAGQRPLPAAGPARSHPSRREQHQDQDVGQAASAGPDPRVLTLTRAGAEAHLPPQPQ